MAVDESPEQRRHGATSRRMIRPASSIVPPPSGWDVAADSPEPPLHRAPAPTASVPEHGDSPFAAAPPREFTPVEPAQPAPVVPAATPPQSRRTSILSVAPKERLRRVTSEVAEQFRPVGDEKEKRFNPAGFVLLTMLALVIFAIVLATSDLRTAWNFQPDPVPGATPTPTQTQVEERPPTEDPTSPMEPEDDEPIEIVIKEAITYDPSTRGGENQDLAARAYDSNPSTFWRSMRYNSPTYAIKAGLGFSVVLEQEASVSEVVLLLRGKGGKVEIRAGDPRNPTEGELLASGPMDGETTFTFDKPVTTDTIVLWFPELPVASSDGMNRIELAEVTLK